MKTIVYDLITNARCCYEQVSAETARIVQAWQLNFPGKSLAEEIDLETDYGTECRKLRETIPGKLHGNASGDETRRSVILLAQSRIFL
jgi:hypothetical protein